MNPPCQFCPRCELTHLRTIPQGTCLCCEEACHTRCVAPTTCCKQTQQCCCYDQRYAFPCDHEVPFWIACLGITCAGSNKPKAPVAVQQTTVG